jgi:hypothetical protein
MPAEPNAPEFERFSFDATIRLFGVVLPTSEPRLC